MICKNEETESVSSPITFFMDDAAMYAITGCDIEIINILELKQNLVRDNNEVSHDDECMTGSLFTANALETGSIPGEQTFLLLYSMLIWSLTHTHELNGRGE